MTNMLDSAKYNATIRQPRNLPADTGSDNALLLNRWLGPPTELLLDMTHVRTGSRVLDVATDGSDQALQVAERVGCTGHVIATGISPRILERAARHARIAGLRLETLATDAASLDVPEGSVDAAVCRMGLTYVADRQAALGRIKRALVTGGRFGAMVFSTPSENPCISLPLEIIRRNAQRPERTLADMLEVPGPFCLSARLKLFRELEAAGFHDIEVRAVWAPLRMASAAECVRFERESFGGMDQMLAGFSDRQRARVWAEIEEGFGRYESNGSFEGPCELLIASAVK